MNKKLLVALFLVICSQTVCLAQSSRNRAQDTNQNVLSKHLLLPYLSGSSLIEYYNSIDLGLMKMLKNDQAIGAEIGYIFSIGADQFFETDFLYKQVSGLKAYFYYRFLLQIGENYPFNSQTFFDIEPQFYWATFNSERIAGYICNDEFGDCSYYRFFDAKVQRIVPGINLKLGKIYNYDPFYMTVFCGAGIRNVTDFSKVMRNPKPDKVFDRSGEMSNLQVGTVLNLRLGVQLAYKIWK